MIDRILAGFLALLLAPMVWVTGQSAYFLATRGDHGLGDPTGRWWLITMLLALMPAIVGSLVVVHFLQRRLAGLATPFLFAASVVAGGAVAGLGAVAIWFAFVRDLAVSMTALIVPASLGVIATLIFLLCERYLVGHRAT